MTFAKQQIVTFRILVVVAVLLLLAYCVVSLCVTRRRLSEGQQLNIRKSSSQCTSLINHLIACSDTRLLQVAAHLRFAASGQGKKQVKRN